MQFTLDTNALTPLDRQILIAVVETMNSGKAPEGAPASVEPAAEVAETPKPVKKAPAKAKVEPVVVEKEAGDDPADDVPTSEEAGAGGDEPDMGAAVALATQLISKGKSPEIKVILGQLGAKRVSEIDPSKAGEFYAALAALDA